jgi:OFA family oxalate/formate antiporter-like MFS transporter
VKALATRPDWPFDIRRTPFFYGWVIWLLSTLGFLFSIPGQTMGMAVFTDQFIEALGLSRTQLSLAYLVGTVGSSIFLTRAGRWYDRLGGRVMVAMASVALALMLLFIASTDLLAGLAGGGPEVSFILIMLGYFGVRFFGQGVLTSAARNVMQLWFEKRRGLVSSARGVFVSLGFSLAPLGLAWLIGVSGWRGSVFPIGGLR